MKRFWGIIVLMVLIGALMATVRLRDGWVDGTLESRRSRQLESMEPQWPDVNQAPYAKTPTRQAK